MLFSMFLEFKVLKKIVYKGGEPPIMSVNMSPDVEINKQEVTKSPNSSEKKVIKR